MLYSIIKLVAAQRIPRGHDIFSLIVLQNDKEESIPTSGESSLKTPLLIAISHERNI